MTIEDLVHDALHDYADSFEPSAGTWLALERAAGSRVRRRVAAAVIAAAVVAAAAIFAVSQHPTATPTTVLSAAGSATEQAGSFRVQFQTGFSDASDPSHVEDVRTAANGVVDVTHQASHITSETTVGVAAPQRSEQISIGPDLWISEPLQPSLPGFPRRRWTHTSRSLKAPMQLGPLGVDPIGLLDRLKTKATVDFVGHDVIRGVETDHYQVHSSTPPTTLRALQLSNGREELWVSRDHLVRRLKTFVDVTQGKPGTPPTKQTQEFLFEFFDFGVQATIEPPPADQVLDMRSSPGPATPSTTTPKLPAPNIAGHSALQLRPVEVIHEGGCRAVPSNPPDTTSATLPGPSGTCYDLARSALTVTRAQVAAVASFTNQLDVHLTFSAADSAAFDRVADANYQRQVAIVMFGRVLTAPIINATHFQGTATVPSIDPQTAANVIAALSG